MYYKHYIEMRYRYSSNDLEAQKVWIGQAGRHEKIMAIRTDPEARRPRPLLEGEST
jgi:hypothetical protein